MITKKLRLCIYNTYDNQGAAYCTTDQERIHRIKDPPSWTLRIEGKILDDNVGSRGQKSNTPKFSAFFKKIFIQLDKDEYPNEWHIEWNKDETVGETDGFEIKRIGSKDTLAHLFFHLDCPAKYKVSPHLAQELKLSQGSFTKTHVILTLWHYIRGNKLQDPNNPSKVICNQHLQKIFGVPFITYHDIPRLLLQHLGPPDPIQLNFLIKTQGTPVEQYYEIQVELPNPMPPFNTDCNKAEIDKLDERIHELLREINERQLNRRFFLELASDPVNVIEEYIVEQVRDYQIVQHGKDSDAQRHASFYLHPSVDHAVNTYLERKVYRHYQQDDMQPDTPTNMNTEHPVDS